MRWYLGAIALLLIGMVLQLGLLVYAMYALLGVMLVSRYMAREWIENLHTERICSRVTAEVGQTADVTVTVQNQGGLPVLWVLMEDSVPRSALTQRPPRLRIKGKRSRIARVPSHGTKQLTYTVEFLMRGYYQFGPVLLETGDLLGLHRRYRVVGQPRFVLVYPRLVPLQGYDLASRRPIGEVRLTHRLFEDPTRMAGVRPYQHGDPLNRIHWRATARTGELHSKTFEPSCIAGASLLLDFHSDAYESRGEPHCSELAVTTVASLANALYQLGQQVGFYTNGRDAVDRIKTEGVRHEFRTRDAARDTVGMSEQSDRLQPLTVETRRGDEQFMQILNSLARVELTDGLLFDQLVTEVASSLPRDASVVAVLSDVSEKTAVALGNLRRHGFAVTAVLIIFDDFGYAARAGRLMAEGIDTRRVLDEAELAALCSEQMVRRTV